MPSTMTELERLEWEARQKPSPPPRVNEPWHVIVARHRELQRDWLPTRRCRRRTDGRFASTMSEARS